MDELNLDEKITVFIVPVKDGKPVKIAYEPKPITAEEYNEFLELVKKYLGQKENNYEYKKRILLY